MDALSLDVQGTKEALIARVLATRAEPEQQQTAEVRLHRLAKLPVQKLNMLRNLLSVC